MPAAKKVVSFAAAREGNGTSGSGRELLDTSISVYDNVPEPPRQQTSSRKAYDRWTSVPAGVIRPPSPLEDPPGDDDVEVEEVTRRQDLFACPVYIVKMKNLFERAFHVIMSEGGLLIILVVYSVIGAAAFVAIEGKAEDERIAESEERQRATELGNSTDRRDFTDAILTLMQDSDRNLSDALEEFLGQYEIRPMQMSAGDQMNGTTTTTTKQWNWFGALIFCGTVYTTVGE